MRSLVIIGALLALSCTAAQAQDVTGTWQGTLQGGQPLRIVLKLTKADVGWMGTVTSIDQSPAAMPLSGISVKDNILRFVIAPIGGTYEGTVTQDGKSISGNWTQAQIIPLSFARATPQTLWAFDGKPAADTTAHKVQFVTVDKSVKLEVLDWGGAGRPLVFLAGLGFTAHALDKLAPKFTGKYHVYGVTRRGTAPSDKPDPATADYSADRLADDVLEVADKLKLNRPVIVGHSLAGEELSSIGSRHPEKVAGLIYLEAGYAYALYSPGSTAPLGTNLVIEAATLREQLAQFKSVPGVATNLRALIPDVQNALHQLEKDLEAAKAQLPADGKLPAVPDTADGRIAVAIINGEQKYTGIKVPALALYAVHAAADNASQAAQDAIARQNAAAMTQANAFAAANPSARVVRLQKAEHAIWLSNPDEVEREMNAFLGSLTKP
jgi:pimeloyl-ACP methyl ester carboxylesterase